MRLLCTPLCDGYFGVLAATFPLCQKRHSVSLKRSPRICSISSGKSKSKNAASVPVLHIKSHQIDHWLLVNSAVLLEREIECTQASGPFSLGQNLYLTCPRTRLRRPKRSQRWKWETRRKGGSSPMPKKNPEQMPSTPQNGNSRSRRVFWGSPPRQFLCGFEDGVGNLEDGARYRVRTCDPYRVKVVLYH